MSPADPKQLATTAAECALAGATFTLIDDDRGDPLYIVTQGPATHHFRNLPQVKGWLAELQEVAPC